MVKKRGRPKGINSRSKLKATRMTLEEDYKFRKTCEKEGYSESEGLRMGVKALQYLSENGLISCITENENDDFLNYCYTENDENEDEDDFLY